jgi:hypothetical protein
MTFNQRQIILSYFSSVVELLKQGGGVRHPEPEQAQK